MRKMGVLSGALLLTDKPAACGWHFSELPRAERKTAPFVTHERRARRSKARLARSFPHLIMRSTRHWRAPHWRVWGAMRKAAILRAAVPLAGGPVRPWPQFPELRRGFRMAALFATQDVRGALDLLLPRAEFREARTPEARAFLAGLETQ